MNFRLKLCPSNKWTFYSAQDAWKRLCELKVLNRGKDCKVPSRIYQCPDCGYWHLTSQGSRPH
jgi:predicted RNA-binding Zn-ribbon protein involved in translation (DUF1610 family)